MRERNCLRYSSSTCGRSRNKAERFEIRSAEIEIPLLQHHPAICVLDMAISVRRLRSPLSTPSSSSSDTSCANARLRSGVTPVLGARKCAAGWRLGISPDYQAGDNDRAATRQSDALIRATRRLASKVGIDSKTDFKAMRFKDALAKSVERRYPKNRTCPSASG